MPTTYFVSLAGGASNANSGTQLFPFATIPFGLSVLSPGDKLFLRGGNWDQRLSNAVSNVPGGSSFLNATTIAGYPGETVTIKPTAQLGQGVLTLARPDQLGGQTNVWIVWQDLHFDGTNVIGGGANIIFVGQSHNRFLRCEVFNQGAGGSDPDVSAAIIIGGNAGVPAIGVELINCDIHDNSLISGVLDGTNAPYAIYDSRTTGTLVEGCRIYRHGGYGIHGYSSAGDHHSATYKNNILWDNQLYASNIEAAHILASEGNGHRVIGNVVYQTLSAPTINGIIIQASQDSLVANNTVYSIPRSGILMQAGAVNTAVINNIVVDSNTVSGGFQNIDDQGSGTTFANNLCHGTGGTAHAAITSDPFFLSAPSDFHLGVGSPAIDVGSDVSGSGVDVDIDGTPRPVSSIFDLGAYEYFDLSQENPFEAPGTAHGTSTAVAVGRAVAPQGAGSAAGSSTAVGVAQSLSRQGAGSAAGIATVVGRSQRPPLSPTENPKTYTIRIREARIGANGIIEFEGVREDISVYDQVAQSPLLGALVQSGSPAPTQTPIQDDQSDNSRPGSTRLVLLDVPQLRAVDTGPGFYAAATGTSPGWNGAVLHEQIGADWVQIAELGQRAAIGQATTKLLSGPVTDFDETGRTYVFDDTHTVDVTLIDTESTLSSVSDGDLQVGVNAAALGVHGRWEIISFGTATQLSERTWRLSHLLRGLKGTEWAIGMHMAGEQFVLLNESLRRVSDNWSDIDVARSFRGVSIGTLLEDASTQVFTEAGVSVKPLSPVFIRGEEDADDNRVLHAYRRSRYDGLAGRDGVDPPPLDEPNLVMEWDIYNALGTVVLRTLRSTDEFVVYSAVDQVTDFGSIPSTISVCVYQISTNRGRGYSGCAVISSFDSIDTEDIPPGAAAGADKEIQYNDLGNLAGDPTHIFDKVTKLVTMQALNLTNHVKTPVTELTMSGTLTLVEATSTSSQFLNPNGSNRQVNLPVATTGLTYFIMHVGGSNTITVKDNGGSTLKVMAFGEFNTFVYSGSAWRVI